MQASPLPALAARSPFRYLEDVDGPRIDRLGFPSVGLDRRRSTRYRGDDRAISIAAFLPDDRATALALYAFLATVRRLVQDPAATTGPGVSKLVVASGMPAMVDRVRSLGREAREHDLREVIHDLRGGAFNALVLQLSRFGEQSFRRAWLGSVDLLARDHQKMMRGLLHDLDPEARARDLALVPHSLSTLVSALAEFPAKKGVESLTLDVDCAFDATIAESCVECGAIDRIVYNLLNNAVRHAEPPRLWVKFLRAGEDLRVVVTNVVSGEHRVTLQRQVAGRAAPLFGGFTTTGSGQGLSIVTRLVGSAYGILDVSELLQGGHIGAELQGSFFSVWFHWPLSGA